MAIRSGVGKHFAWLSCDGGTFPIKSGTVNLNANRRCSTFHVQVPMQYPGAMGIAGSMTATVSVQSVAGSGPLIIGMVDNISFGYPNFHGGGIISVSGRDMSGKLHQKKSSQKFSNQPTSAVVQQCCGQAGLGAAIAGGGSNMAGKFVNQEYAKMTDGISLATVIHQCAELDGATWFGDPLAPLVHYVVQGAFSGGVYSTFVNMSKPIQGDYLSLVVSQNMEASSPIQATVNSWNPKQKQVNTGQAQGGGSAGGDQIEYEYHIPNLLMDHCQAYAQAKAFEASRHAFSVRAELVGDPSIQLNGGLSVSGTVFDNVYQIDSIVHRFGMGGYTMEVCGKTAGG